MHKLNSGPGFMYWGTHRGWLVFNSVNGASGDFQQVVDESNQRVLIRRLQDAGIEECSGCGEDSHDGGYAVETFRGFGGSQVLLINPDHAGALGIAAIAEADLDDYPILDDDDRSELEYERSIEGLEEFIRCEFRRPWGGRTSLAPFIYSAWPEPIGLESWPNLDSDWQRDYMATAIREWRKFEREYAHQQVA